MLKALAETGLDMWAFDYYGFGVSDRYPQMSESANAYPPLGQAEEVADQVVSAVNYLLSRNGGRPIMLLGDSRGSVVAGVYAAREPGTISRLVLFAPVTPFTSDDPPPNPPAYVTITPKELWSVLSSWAETQVRIHWIHIL